MIAHVILFRPRADLSSEARQALIGLVEKALGSIPSIRTWHVGRRVVLGHAYETREQADYPYVAILEFDDASALGAYLEHPAHVELAARFYAAVDDALVYDFEMAEGRAGAFHGTPLGTSGDR